MAAKKQFYIDMNHLEDGIYQGYASCEQVKKTSKKTNFYGFYTLEEAKRALNEALKDESNEIQNDTKVRKKEFPNTYAFTDGSYNPKTMVYGYGGFLVHDGCRYELTGSGNDADIAGSRNVAGEVLGAMAAVKKAMELGIKKLTLYYDYEGIKKWTIQGPMGWKANKPLTQNYKRFIEEADIDIDFIHVKGHSDIPGNEEADRLAKRAVGID